MSRRFPMPPAFQQAARAWLAASGGEEPPVPVQARASATVLLLRDADGGAAGEGCTSGGAVQVFMLHRAATMAFAPNAYVFPGGGLEARDLAPGESLAAPGPASLRAAAVREVHEETGLALDPGQLVPLGHWVTPEFEPRRYSTWFFGAACPAGAEPRLTTTEAITGEWVDPVDLLARAGSDPELLLPPTLVHLELLAQARSVQSLLLIPPEVATVTPVPIELDGQVVVTTAEVGESADGTEV